MNTYKDIQVKKCGNFGMICGGVIVTFRAGISDAAPNNFVDERLKKSFAVTFSPRSLVGPC